eukprot:3174887-Alexandrium_andersonii.AAC.1
MAAPAADKAAAMPPAVANIRAMAHANNWLTIQRTTSAVAYDQGAMPGDPWSDLVFNLLQARVMHNVRIRMREENLCPEP